MMFSGILLKSKAAVRNLAIAAMGLLLFANILEMSGIVFFNIDTKGMIVFDSFSLLFNSIAFVSTLIYLLLSARDIEKVGINYAEYFALIFFICILKAYN